MVFNILLSFVACVIYRSLAIFFARWLVLFFITGVSLPLIGKRVNKDGLLPIMYKNLRDLAHVLTYHTIIFFTLYISGGLLVLLSVPWNDGDSRVAHISAIICGTVATTLS